MFNLMNTKKSDKITELEAENQLEIRLKYLFYQLGVYVVIPECVEAEVTKLAMFSFRSNANTCASLTKAINRALGLVGPSAGSKLKLNGIEAKNFDEWSALSLMKAKNLSIKEIEQKLSLRETRTSI